jgi:hypothetical protein
VPDIVLPIGQAINGVQRHIRYRDMGDGTFAEVIAGGGSSGAVTVTPAASEAHLGQVGGAIANPSANFTRPNDTTAYASGDLVANSTTAGSVSAMTFTVARVSSGSVMLRRCRFQKSGTSVNNASFRVHLFASAPGTVTNGDNGAFSVSGAADYLGAFDVTVDRAFTDGALGFGNPVVGFEIGIKLSSGTTIRGLIEARAAYTPVAQEVFTVGFDAYQD